jgi:hypothetical protein
MEEKLDTFPRRLLNHARVRPDHPATREKDLGIWQTWSWREVADEVRALACGLAAQGFRRGMHLAIIGDNRPRLYWSMVAAQCVGGVPVPMYQDAPAAEFVFVLQNAEIAYAIVEDQEQVDKMLEARPQVPSLAHIYYDDPRGMRDYEGVLSYDELVKIGREYDRAHPGFFDDEVAKGAADDVSVMLYTSGTTGKPKGVCQTHAAFIAAAEGGCEFDRLTADDSILSYLPMAWVGDHLFSFAQWLVAGFTINCPESSDTVMTDLREIGPTYYFAPPRIFENLLTQVMIRMEDAAAPKRWLFRQFTAVARRCGAEILDGKPVSLGDRVQYALGNVLVYGPLRNVLGMSRIRIAYTAGAAIGPDPVSLLSLDRRQPQAAVWVDGDLCLRVPATGRRRALRHRRHAGAEGRREDRRQWRSDGAWANAAQGVLQAPGRDGGIDRRRRLVPHGRCRLLRRRRPVEDHRPREGRRQDDDRRDVRAELHREQAQVLSAHQGSGRIRPRSRHRLHVHQHRCRIGRQLGRAARPCVLRAIPTSRRSPRSTSW